MGGWREFVQVKRNSKRGESPPPPPPPARPLVWVRQFEYFRRRRADPKEEKEEEVSKRILGWYPDYREMKEEELPRGLDLSFGCSFKTLNINVPIYLEWLLYRFIRLGGKVLKGYEVESLDQRPPLPSPPDLILTCLGLGSSKVEGIQDEGNMFAQRGQVVVVRAPWVEPIPTPLPDSSGSSPSSREIRAVGDGTLICGGTRIKDDWDPNVRPETTREILRRCLQIYPQLLPPEKRSILPHPPSSSTISDQVEHVDVQAVQVGLRPSRKGGVRFELELSPPHQVKVVHNYGYGGFGYQASWGAAEGALELIERSLSSLKGAAEAEDVTPK
ncbi:DAO-domain-containing protein [Violaceomyces palustris]|uniref:DAO-domain-containing protein n=1 Tax=Violaceomyces palustris TaxID=1673888 RepID=A0ACD0NRJ5_9BASI|nr:DAO-domain-containing protein [Violaceomyces palustris]